jgi:hypothetical protein
MKEQEEKTKQINKRPAKRSQLKGEELKTEPPISEKDEVKNAEERLRKS